MNAQRLSSRRSRRPEVVGLDLSYSGTGVALRGAQLVLKDDGGSSPHDYTVRADRVSKRILKLIPPGAVVFMEDYAYSRHSSMAHEIGGLGGVVRLDLARAGVPWAVVKTTSLKVFATGAGTAAKEAVLAEAIRRLSYAGNDDNEADALWLREMGLHLLRDPAATPLPKIHTRALEKVQLPIACTLEP